MPKTGPSIAIINLIIKYMTIIYISTYISTRISFFKPGVNILFSVSFIIQN